MYEKSPKTSQTSVRFVPIPTLFRTLGRTNFVFVGNSRRNCSGSTIKSISGHRRYGAYIKSLPQYTHIACLLSQSGLLIAKVLIQIYHTDAVCPQSYKIHLCSNHRQALKYLIQIFNVQKFAIIFPLVFGFIESDYIIP